MSQSDSDPNSNESESSSSPKKVSNESLKRRRVTISEIVVTDSMVERLNSNKRMKRVGFDLDENFKEHVERRDHVF